MLQVMMLIGGFLAALTGLTGAVLGCRQAAKSADARENKPAPTSVLVGRPFSTYEIAVLMR